MKTVIVGAGASGLVAAIFAARKGEEVTLIERNDQVGKKLLITGNGKCNYFNVHQELKYYNSSSHDLLKQIITDDNLKNVLKLFSEIGIVPKIKNGYYYPYSELAVSVREALKLECELLGVNIVNDVLVTKIVKNNAEFVINNDIKADRIIICTGSKAFAKTGSDGNGYELAKAFGHQIIKPLPALGALIGVKEKYLSLWSGVRCEAKIALYENEKLLKEELGELQLTDSGVSGIPAFNLSGIATRILDNGGQVKVVINFMPWCNSLDEVLDYLEKRSEVVTGRTTEQLLEGIFNYKLLKSLFTKCKINPLKYFDELNKKEKYALAQGLYEFTLEIIEMSSFDKSQVCSGGVPLTEVNLKTMESKIVKNLYFAGEILDVNGDCGGYNLTFAWISGMLSGKGGHNA